MHYTIQIYRQMPVAAKISRKQYYRNIIWLKELEKWITEAKTNLKICIRKKKERKNTIERWVLKPNLHVQSPWRLPVSSEGIWFCRWIDGRAEPDLKQQKSSEMEDHEKHVRWWSGEERSNRHKNVQVIPTRRIGREKVLQGHPE